MPTLLAVSLMLSLATANCRLDSAVVTAVPPDTLHVITISECGALKCWARWIETNGQRIGEARVCSGEGNNSGDKFGIP